MALLETFSAVIAGIVDGQEAALLGPFFGPIGMYIDQLGQMAATRAEGVPGDVMAATLGVIGDMACNMDPAASGQFKHLRGVQFIVTAGQQSRDPATRETATWARDILATC